MFSEIFTPPFIGMNVSYLATSIMQLVQENKHPYIVIQSIYLFFFEFTGVGVFAKKNFAPGAFLLQYPGELVSEEEAERREKLYKQQHRGCFMYFFTYENKTMW